MAGKTTTACTHEQYETIIKTLYDGIGDCIQPNPRIATILVIEANVGLRIGDTLSLRRSSFIKTPSGHAFNIVEHKTGKVRRFKLPRNRSTTSSLNMRTLRALRAMI